MKDKIAYLGKFDYGLMIGVKSVIPGDQEDVVWESFKSLRNYLQKLEPLLVQLEKTVEEQQLEIEKLKLDKANRVQKIEVVKFLDATEVPRKEEDGD